VESALNMLGEVVCSSGQRAELGDEDVRAFAARSVVALAAGGYGSRLQAVTELEGVHKTALRMPTGETMIERTIKMYRDAGFRDFVALVFHRAESIINMLGDGGDLGINLTYSMDPEIPVGRGGAIRNALENGSIPEGRNLIVHNPDDVIVRYPGSFPRDIVAAHLAGTERGAIATAVVVGGKRVAYTGMSIVEGFVSEVVSYPFVPIPAHIGVTIFAPDVNDYFRRLFSLTEKSDFEAVLFPKLVEEGRLYTAVIPNECWLAVNDPKSLAQFVETLQEEAARSVEESRSSRAPSR
jgi:NDP-sugar pyrophosphorylase family protein